jgi:hypothetical protein
MHSHAERGNEIAKMLSVPAGRFSALSNLAAGFIPRRTASVQDVRGHSIHSQKLLLHSIRLTVNRQARFCKHHE